MAGFIGQIRTQFFFITIAQNLGLEIERSSQIRDIIAGFGGLSTQLRQDQVLGVRGEQTAGL